MRVVVQTKHMQSDRETDLNTRTSGKSKLSEKQKRSSISTTLETAIQVLNLYIENICRNRVHNK